MTPSSHRPTHACSRSDVSDLGAADVAIAIARARASIIVLFTAHNNDSQLGRDVRVP